MPRRGLDSLCRAAGRLPPVGEYFNGWRHDARFGPTVPDNLLLFCRTQVHALRSGRKARDFHYRHVLIAALRGRGTVDIDGRGHRLSAGEALLVRPFQLHDYRDIAAGPLCWLFFTFEQSEDRQPWGVSRKITPEVAFLLEQLVRWRLAHANKPPDHIARAGALALAVALELLGVSPVGRPAPARDKPATHWEQKLTTIVRQRGTRASGIKRIAAEMDLSPSHLRALFRERFGISLGRYLHDQQVNRAIALLRDPTRRVGEVAETCGYGSIYSFSRAFRRATGRSASQFRRSILPPPAT